MGDAHQNKGGVLMKKRPGYYYRLRKQLKTKLHDEMEVKLKSYPPKAQTYIVLMAFKDLPRIKII